MVFEQEIELLSIIILLELSIMYLILSKFYDRLKLNEQRLSDLMLLQVFREILAFVSDQDIVEQGLVGSLMNMKDRDLLDYLRSKIWDIRSDLNTISDRIAKFYDVERSLNKIRSYFFQIRWMLVITMIAIPLSLILPKELSLVTLGLAFSLELVSLYYNFISIFLYIRLSKHYSDALKSLESL